MKATDAEVETMRIGFNLFIKLIIEIEKILLSTDSKLATGFNTFRDGMLAEILLLKKGDSETLLQSGFISLTKSLNE